MMVFSFICFGCTESDTCKEYCWQNNLIPPWSLFSRIWRRTAYHCIKRRRVRPKWPYTVYMDAHTHAYTTCPWSPGYTFTIAPKIDMLRPVRPTPNYWTGGLVATMAPRPFAPASIQSSDSSCTSRKVLSTLGVIPLNTTSFLASQRFCPL
jgi:hypothetical protein